MAIKKVNITEEMVSAIYDEMERRLEMDIEDGVFKWESEVIEYRKAMLQGIYSTLMTIAADWPRTTWYTSEEEEKRYSNEMKPLKHWREVNGE